MGSPAAMPGFIFRRMPDTYRRQSAPGGVQIDKTRPRPEPGKKFKPRKPRGKCTLLRAGGAEQAPRGTGAYASDEFATKIFQNLRTSTVSSAQSSGYLRSCSLPTELKRIIYFSTSREGRKSILALSLVRKPILCFYSEFAAKNKK